MYSVGRKLDYPPHGTRLPLNFPQDIPRGDDLGSRPGQILILEFGFLYALRVGRGDSFDLIALSNAHDFFAKLRELCRPAKTALALNKGLL